MIDTNFEVLYGYLKNHLKPHTEEESGTSRWATYFIDQSEFQYEVREEIETGIITIFYEKRSGEDLIPYVILDNQGFFKVLREEQCQQK